MTSKLRNNFTQGKGLMKYDLIGENESMNELHFLWEI
jgi:hypothetical protein